MLKPILDPIPGAAHSVTDFSDRIFGATPVATPPPATPSVQNDEFLTVKACAATLHLTTKTIHNMLKDGRLRHFRCGKVIRIRAADIRDLIGKKGGV
jgi:excisionase family DNA binding protein